MGDSAFIKRESLVAIADAMREATGETRLFSLNEILERTSLAKRYIEKDFPPSLVLPNNISAIGSTAFYNCTSLKSITIPESVRTIASFAFNGCTSLTTVNLSEGLIEIGNAFQNCSSLTSLTIPASVTYISSYAFKGCSKLVSINIPEGVEMIYDYTFQNCTSLTSITLHANIKNIYSTAFSGCTNLTTINVPWSEGAVANAPWGATNATINYNYVANGGV